MSATAYRLYDMHCHLDRMANGAEVARDAAARGIAILDATVAPDDAVRARADLGHLPNVRVGAGLHPWWLANGSCDEGDVEKLCAQVAQSRFVGEIGLDFSARYRDSAKLQAAALRRITRTIAANPLPRRTLTIHAVRSAGAVLDILEEEGVLPSAQKQAPRPEQPACIFHWFTGTSDEFARARRAGCFFSFNEHGLATKRGREYARICPGNRLLLETDAPPELDKPYSARELEVSLERALAAIATVRDEDPEALRRTIAQTSAHLG